MMSNKHTLMRRFRFEAAHRLGKGFKGKCSNIHGHSFHGWIFYDSEVNSSDMCVDFSDIGTVVKEKVEAVLDHALILHKDDELVELLKDKVRVVELEDNPTMEVLSKYIFEIMKRECSGMGANIIAVELHETENNHLLYKEDAKRTL